MTFPAQLSLRHVMSPRGPWFPCKVSICCTSWRTQDAGRRTQDTIERSLLFASGQKIKPSEVHFRCNCCCSFSTWCYFHPQAFHIFTNNNNNNTIGNNNNRERRNFQDKLNCTTTAGIAKRVLGRNPSHSVKDSVKKCNFTASISPPELILAWNPEIKD